MAEATEKGDDRQISFAETLERDGNNAVADQDPGETGDEDDGVFTAATDPDDSQSDSDSSTDKGDDDKSDPKWDADRQKRDQQKAERITTLESSLAGVAAKVDEMSQMNRELLARLVHGGKEDAADETPDAATAALARDIKNLDPENAEVGDIITALNAIVGQAQTNSKAVTAKLEKALAAQVERQDKALASEKQRNDERDQRDARRDAQDTVIAHVDGLMVEKFKGSQAMRKEITQRAETVLADAGYKADDLIPVRTAKMALTAAAGQVLAKLEADRRGRESPTQDSLAGGIFADLVGEGSQTTKEALKTMGPRAR